jgi:hypothetical protein
MLHLCAACKSNIKRYHNALKEAEERGAKNENEACAKFAENLAHSMATPCYIARRIRARMEGK